MRLARWGNRGDEHPGLVAADGTVRDLTGTPAGMGMGFRPPVYLRARQTMRFGIAGLGEQVTKVVTG